MYGVNQEGALEAMKNQIDDYDICDLIQLNNAVYGQDKENVLLHSDVFIMTSRFEGLPMGLIEALSYGLPCVATNGTNLTVEINKYNAGWTAHNNVESVEQALLIMLQEYSAVKEKGQNALDLSASFSWSAIAEKSHIKYVELIENSINQ